jgi:mannose-6-phosphate isomerase-like protein (cupin superfamily)
MSDALVLPPGAGERLVPAGGRRPPAHVHPDRTEAFWVLEGEVEFELDGRLTAAAAGSFVLVPGGVAHTFGASAPRHAAGARWRQWVAAAQPHKVLRIVSAVPM